MLCGFELASGGPPPSSHWVSGFRESTLRAGHSARLIAVDVTFVPGTSIWFSSESSHSFTVVTVLPFSSSLNQHILDSLRMVSLFLLLGVLILLFGDLWLPSRR